MIFQYNIAVEEEYDNFILSIQSLRQRFEVLFNKPIKDGAVVASCKLSSSFVLLTYHNLYYNDQR